MVTSPKRKVNGTPRPNSTTAQRLKARKPEDYDNQFDDIPCEEELDDEADSSSQRKVNGTHRSIEPTPLSEDDGDDISADQQRPGKSKKGCGKTKGKRPGKREPIKSDQAERAATDPKTPFASLNGRTNDDDDLNLIEKPVREDNDDEESGGSSGDDNAESGETSVDDHDGQARKSPGDFIGSMYQVNRQEGIFCPHWAIQITSTKAELLVLSQFAYWFGSKKDGTPRAKVQHGGYYWVYKTHAKLGRELGLRKDQVRGAIRGLVVRGIIVPDDNKRAGHVVNYRLVPTAIQKAIEAAEIQEAVEAANALSPVAEEDSDGV